MVCKVKTLMAKDSGSGTSSASTYHNGKPGGSGKSVSGYSADMELSADGRVPPVYIALEGAGSKRKVGNDAGCNKRRKMIEIQFAAKTVKADLARGGLAFPALSMGGPKVLADSGIDFTRTKLLRASDLSSPFLIKRKASVYDNEMLIAWDELITAAGKLYDASPSGRTDTTTGDNKSDTDSSTSSFTSSENDAETSRPLDSSKSTDAEIESGQHGQAPHAVVSSRPCITMKKALESSNTPRLLALSFHPFMIVHVNAEFTRFTGLSSAKVLGKPFSAIVAAESKSLVEASFSVFSMKAVHDIVVNITTLGEKKHECLARTTLVGAESVKNSSVASSDVSHFSIDVSPIDVSHYGQEKDLVHRNGAALVSTGNLLIG